MIVSLSTFIIIAVSVFSVVKAANYYTNSCVKQLRLCHVSHKETPDSILLCQRQTMYEDSSCAAVNENYETFIFPLTPRTAMGSSVDQFNHFARLVYPVPYDCSMRLDLGHGKVLDVVEICQQHVNHFCDVSDGPETCQCDSYTIFPACLSARGCDGDFVTSANAKCFMQPTAASLTVSATSGSTSTIDSFTLGATATPSIIVIASNSSNSTAAATTTPVTETVSPDSGAQAITTISETTAVSTTAASATVVLGTSNLPQSCYHS